MKRIFVFIFCSLIITSLQAQERNIGITPVLPSGLDVPERLHPTLQQKLLQIATNNGYGSESNDFILTCNVSVLEKTAVPVVPPQINVHLEISLYVVNAIEKVIVAEKSIEIAGIDKTENSAYTQALRQLNPRKPEIRSFMTSAREKIIDYYAERTPVLIAKAQSLAKTGKTDEALLTLSSIPESVPEYPSVAELMSDIFLQDLNKKNESIIISAQAAYAQKDYTEALDILATVDPLSNQFGKATKMMEQIQSTMEEKERQAKAEELERLRIQMEYAQKVHEDEVMLKKAQIESSYKYASEIAPQTSLTGSSTSAWLRNLIGL